MTAKTDQTVARIGLLWRGDRADNSTTPKAEATLGPLFNAFADLNVAAEPVVYADDAIVEIREQLLALDGVLVWVNPIQDGANRAQLDALLREVSDRGVWVSAYPDVILAMGTKEVLFRTRTLGWGTDTDLYPSFDELIARFPARLRRDGVRVIKQARGNGGNGVWKVELITDNAVRVQHALTRDSVTEQLPFTEFLARCEQYFAWSGALVDQAFVDRLADGMIRCYFVHDEIVGFCHQWPKGLLTATPENPNATRPPMEPPDAPAYKILKANIDDEWLPQMKRLLALDTGTLPVIWDADFLYGPTTDTGQDTYILCEVNVSAVWPYPPSASARLAQAVVARIAARRAGRRIGAGGASSLTELDQHETT